MLLCVLAVPSYCRVLLMVRKGQVVHLLTFIQGLLINASNTQHMGEFLCICLGGVHVCAQNKEYNWDHLEVLQPCTGVEVQRHIFIKFY